MKIELWSLNRIFRWFGFVLVIWCDGRADDDPDREPSMIGIVWTGWPPDKGWLRHCERTKRATELPESEIQTEAEN